MPHRNRSTKIKSILRRIRVVRPQFVNMPRVYEKLGQAELALSDCVAAVSSCLLHGNRPTPEQVKLVLRLKDLGYLHKQIEPMANVSKRTIRRILDRHGLGVRKRKGERLLSGS
jgi:hypothetical protein